MDVNDAVNVYRSARRQACEEQRLVLQALAIEHECVAGPAGYDLIVQPADARFAGEQLALYHDENRDWPPRPSPKETRTHDSAGSGVAGYVIVLLAAAWTQTHAAWGFDWYGAGRLNAGALLGGDWWRSITALTLHLDLPHLVGNLVFGGLFGLAAGQFLGAGVAWLAILLSGALGNGLNAFLQPPAHSAVGASTAVFGALGIVSLYLWRQRRGLGASWAYQWAPVIVGVVLLAFLGVGGERTDVVAHLTGFVCGGALGAAAERLGPVSSRSRQRTAAAATVFLLIAAWAAGLTAAG